MTVATLADVLLPAQRGGYAVAGLVTLGWEDMRAYVDAAEAEDVPVILQAGPSCREHTPLPILGTMLRFLAERAKVPVVVHLDHGHSREECAMAIDCGFTSVMFDGSRMPFSQNVARTAEIVELAHQAGVSCEGEIGFVGYAGGEQSAGTDPSEAAEFARETGVDAMAVSVGNVHLQRSNQSMLQEDRIREIEALTSVPLVIHGGSGVPVEQRQKLARYSNVCKFNIGTELRQAFGQALRSSLEENSRFDRVEILRDTQEPLMKAAQKVLKAFKPASIK